MRTTTALALLGAGAILAFAVHGGLPGFNMALTAGSSFSMNDLRDDM